MKVPNRLALNGSLISFFQKSARLIYIYLLGCQPCWHGMVPDVGGASTNKVTKYRTLTEYYTACVSVSLDRDLNKTLNMYMT